MMLKKQNISLKTWLSFILYLMLPLCSLCLILLEYTELPSGWILNRIYWVIPSATAIVILAQLGSYYKKGETKRFVLNICFTVMTMLWMFGLLGGGLVMTTLWNEYEFSLHMEKYVILILSVTALNLTYYIFEWRVYQKDHPSFLSPEKATIKTSAE